MVHNGIYLCDMYMQYDLLVQRRKLLTVGSTLGLLTALMSAGRTPDSISTS